MVRTRMSIITRSQQVTTEQDCKQLSLINDCYKYIMDLTTNGVVITDAIKFVQTNKEKLISKQDKDSKESAYDEDEADIEEKQVETKEPKYETTTNQVF
jgi:hypothetical protein